MDPMMAAFSVGVVIESSKLGLQFHRDAVTLRMSIFVFLCLVFKIRDSVSY
jgi:hypothetical protein